MILIQKINLLHLVSTIKMRKKKRQNQIISVFRKMESLQIERGEKKLYIKKKIK